MKKIILFLSFSLLLTITTFAATGRPTIAVLPFIINNSYKIYIGDVEIQREVVETEFTNSVMEFLVSSGKFNVLDRDNMRKIINENKLTESQWSKPGEETKVGELLVADYLVIGHINRLNFSVKPVYIKLTGEKTHKIVASLKVQFKVVKVKSGSIVFAKQLIKTIDSAQIRREIPARIRKNWTLYDYKDLLFKRTAIEAGNDILRGIYPVKVVSVKGTKVFLNRGNGAGILLNQRYEVVNLGESIVDPDTNEVLGNVQTKVAEIEITNVNPRFSTAKVISSSGIIRKGAICKKVSQLDNYKSEVNETPRTSPKGW